MKTLNRRDFIRASAAGFGVAIVSSGLNSCGVFDEDESTPQVVSFDHGVASGDPLTDRAIIWTKITVENDEETSVSWEVSEAETGTVVTTGRSRVNAEVGHTLKIDAADLQAGRRYNFKFMSNGVESPVGSFKTLPEGDVSAVKFAVVSCSNYPAGYFNVYGEIAKQTDIDAVLHLGDYIYEYGEGGYATDRAEELGRGFLPNNNTEILTLVDYRNRYAQYRSDAQLQACHQNHTFITVWDDHEVTNDAYIDGAENHNEGEGDYESRKLQALQAYFEWMPIRPASAESGDYRSYRKFSFGSLLDLYMLDTRIVGRDQQLDYANYIGVNGFDAASFEADVTATDRTMLGADQLQWLQAEMAQSQATWQVLGQQVLMGRMLLPAAIVTQQMTTEEFGLVATTAQLGARIQAGDTTVTAEELAFFQANQAQLTDANLALIQMPAIPYNLDAWDGYAVEREVLLGTAKQLSKNLVVLAGDTHNAWANNLKDINGDAVGVEFATASVTSPGLELFLGLNTLEAAQGFEAGITSLISDLQYLNGYDRGYLTVRFSANSTDAEWLFVDTIYDTQYSINTARGKDLSTAVGTNTISS